MIKLQTTDPGVIEAFNRLIATGEDPSGALMGIGEVMLTHTRQRFDQSDSPYGEMWAENTDTTLRAALHGSAKNFTKAGKLSKRGNAYLAGKKPLIGESKSLSTQFASTVIGNDMVTLTSLMEYAATQNFGARQGEFGRDRRNHPIPWGDITARQFFPDEARGLPEPMSADITGVLRAALQGAWDGNSGI